jgi:hypothetical protein
MRKKIKLSFETLEKELSKVSANQMLNVMGGGDPFTGATQIVSDYSAFITQQINYYSQFSSSGSVSARKEYQAMANELAYVKEYMSSNNLSSNILYNNNYSASNPMIGASNFNGNTLSITLANYNNPQKIDDFSHEVHHLYKQILRLEYLNRTDTSMFPGATYPEYSVPDSYSLSEEVRSYERQFLIQLDSDPNSSKMGFMIYQDPNFLRNEINEYANSSFNNTFTEYDGIGLTTPYYDDDSTTTYYDDDSTTTYHGE